MLSLQLYQINTLESNHNGLKLTMLGGTFTKYYYRQCKGHGVTVISAKPTAFVIDWCLFHVSDWQI